MQPAIEKAGEYKTVLLEKIGITEGMSLSICNLATE